MSQTFPMIPAGVKPFWIIIPTIIVLMGAIIILTNVAYSSQKASFELSSAGLRLRGDLYGRLIPAASLLAKEAKIINLSNETEYQPVSRTFGTGLPGYSAGWFRLRNRNKALIYVTDYNQVIYVPTTKNYVVLLSVSQPTAFLEKLKQIAS